MKNSCDHIIELSAELPVSTFKQTLHPTRLARHPISEVAAPAPMIFPQQKLCSVIMKGSGCQHKAKTKTLI